jgi:hypothetical protein
MFNPGGSPERSWTHALDFFGVILLLASTAVAHRPGEETRLRAGFYQPSATETNKPGADN